MTGPLTVVRYVRDTTFRATPSTDRVGICREFAVQSGRTIRVVAGNPAYGGASPSRPGCDRRLDWNREVNTAVVIVALSNATLIRKVLP